MSKTQRQISNKLISKRLTSMWDCSVAYREQYLELIYTLCEDVNSSYAMFVYYSVLSNDIDGLLDRDISPSFYDDHRSYYEDNLINSLIKKYPHWVTSHNPLEKAIATFVECEVACRDINERLVSSRRLFDSSVVPSVTMTAARKIEQVLGNVPSIASLPVDFGPGASFSVRGRTSSYDKITGPLDVTNEAVNEAIMLLRSCPGWLSLHGIAPDDTSRIRDMLTVLPGSRLSFVPKTAKTHRPINIEPGLNKIIQKGYGSVLRNRLKRTGLNLNRCPEKHRILAQRASIDESLATVDLSSASDMIAWEVVYELLPREWFQALDNVRSQRYRYENKWFEFHKFSAMGNGYTFELESLIFYALAYASCKEIGADTSKISVFGDDIIIPTEAYPLLSEVLSHFGFLINKEKSFSSGPFRESCGGDFFHGISVRGFYIKDFLKLRTIVRFRNYLYRTGYRFWFIKTWRFLRKMLRAYESYLAGPDDGTDDHIVFDNVDYHGRSFNYVTMSNSRRRLPKRWHCRRVWMLYENMSLEPDWLFPREWGELTDSLGKVIVSLATRIEGSESLEQPFWNPT